MRYRKLTRTERRMQSLRAWWHDNGMATALWASVVWLWAVWLMLGVGR